VCEKKGAFEHNSEALTPLFWAISWEFFAAALGDQVLILLGKDLHKSLLAHYNAMLITQVF